MRYHAKCATSVQLMVRCGSSCPGGVCHFPVHGRALGHALNPMVGVIEGFRWAFLDVAISGRDLWISTISAVVILFAGLLVFARMEDTFADEI